MEHAIEARSLSKSFGEKDAVAGVDLAVSPGEIFGYLGRNGSGKTTTVRMLTTLSAPSGGQAVVGGFDVVKESDKVRAAIGVTMQEAALDPSMLASEHLVLAGRLWGLGAKEAAKRSAELLELFGLTEDADRRIGTYSGGMQRRLDIATSLVGRPAILFLDEPTTGLDPQSRRALWGEIRRLQAEGVTIFLTTQYLEEADQLADRLAIIDSGRIIAEGTPESLKTRHGHRSIGVRQATDAAAIVAEFATLNPSVNGHSVRLELPADTPMQPVLDRVAGLEGSLESVTIADADLEDVFLALTGADINVVAESQDAAS